METITVKTSINAPVQKAWDAFTQPEHITQWNFAHESWCCPHAVNDVQPGGKFSWRMEARDGSFGFDLSGTYDKVEPLERLYYTLDDGRRVEVVFESMGPITLVTQTFEPEQTNPLEMQQQGWQAILESYRKYLEG